MVIETAWILGLSAVIDTPRQHPMHAIPLN